MVCRFESTMTCFRLHLACLLESTTDSLNDQVKFWPNVMHGVMQVMVSSNAMTEGAAIDQTTVNTNTILFISLERRGLVEIVYLVSLINLYTTGRRFGVDIVQ